METTTDRTLGTAVRQRRKAVMLHSHSFTRRTLYTVVACFSGLLSMRTSAAQAQPEVELFHWWTSPGEAAALQILRDHVRSAKVPMTDNPILGGGGGPAMKTLRARVQARNPPTAVQMLGFEVEEWGRRGVLADLDFQAKLEQWDKVVPKELQRFSKHEGKWSAVPTNVHSTNWMWANRRVLEQAGVLKAPTNWEDFLKAAEQVRRAGFVPLAYGGQAWQTAILFDGAVLSVGGPQFYRRLLVDGEPVANAHATIEHAMARMAQLRQLADDQSDKRPWNLATAMVINGVAAFQVMGDWAKAEFDSAGKKAGADYLCFRFPGTEGSVTFSIDNFAMFQVEGVGKIEGQRALATVMMSRQFQTEFNVAKGSAPARSDVSSETFDVCGKKAINDLAKAASERRLVGSLALGHTLHAELKDAISDIVHRHFNGELSNRDAATQVMEIVTRRAGRTRQ
jgi:glucose/mannose transport system substrate-binding protein